MISLMTNVDSLTAQQNMTVNSTAQSNAINQLTSGYRINSSADDAAGLSVANGYRNQIAELNQGVLNANQGVSQLQIVDGGLSNISQMLDRLQTLATESASNTFTGSRATLNTEYQGLLTEVDRQASNIGLSSTNQTNNTALGVYIGGGGTQQANSSVTVDLSGAGNQVDSSGLGLKGTDILGGAVGAVGLSGNTVKLDNPQSLFLTSAGDTQTYNFNYVQSDGTTASRSVTVNNGGVATGISGSAVLSQLNAGLAGTGITASLNSSTASTAPGTVQFSSTGAFTAGVLADTTSTGPTSAAGTAVNTSQYNVTTTGATAGTMTGEAFTITDGTGKSAAIALTAADTTIDLTVSDINAQLATAGIKGVTALASGDDTEISLQGNANFSVVESAASTGAGNVFSATGNQAVTASATSSAAGADALAAITAVTNAVSQLGLVQGVVGAGENKLNYAISLATSQITSFSSAQSQIRDANVAQEAAALSQAQVVQQASIAAMAQANSEGQAVLKLLQNM